MSRPPSTPPDLPGFEYEKLLGSGGFADVFLYRQHRPQRQVAIKVLLADAGDESVHSLFDAEANVMASMSTHPSIVTIYTADVSVGRRPYLVMEYCPRPNYGVRFRRERISAVEALRVGVQIAGAVETAHRAGILHRDIKPANILVTDYNRPALTDFGISVVAGSGDTLDDSQGMSIPWSPPEFFLDSPRADARSDVFSLAATVYSLLAGRTPFEVTDRKNTATDLIHRISSEPLEPLRRPDIPDALDRVLATAMAKDPAGRYDSALAFGRALQQVEMSLSLPITQMDVLDDRGAPAATDDSADDELEGHTRIRKVSTVSPNTGTTGAGGTTNARDRRGPDPFAAVAPSLSGAGSVTSATEAGESTMLRPVSRQAAQSPAATDPSRSPVAPTPSDEGKSGTRPVWPFVVLASFLIIALGVGTVFAVRVIVPPAPEPSYATDGATTDPGQDPFEDPLEPPSSVKIETIVPQEGTTPGRAKVSWVRPEGYSDKDIVRVQWKDLPENYTEDDVPRDEPARESVVITQPLNQPKACVDVQIIRSNGNTSPPVEACLTNG